MGCTVREKHIRATRKIRSTRPEPDHSTTPNSTDLENLENPILTPNSNLNLNSGVDDGGWGYCTEEQLEEILLKNLEFMYNEAINKLVGLGYDEEVALNAILRNGHCYGGMNVLNNILYNSLAYLNNSGGGREGDGEEPQPPFADLRQLEKYSLAGMVCLLQQVKPHLSKGDAMWCLLMSDLHVGRASVMEIPVLPSPSGSGSGNEGESASETDVGNPESGVVTGGSVGVAPELCRFHRGWGFGNTVTSEFQMNGFMSSASEMALQREIVCPKRFNLSPSMKSLLKRNVAMFAAGFRANSKHFQSQSQTCPSSLSGRDLSNGCDTGAEVPATHSEKSQYAKNQDVVNSMMSKFRDLNLDENSERVALDQRDETLLSVIRQIKDLEKQVKERKEWAQEKAMQAARKVSNDLAELNVMRMGRDEILRQKTVKQTLEESTMKQLSEKENGLRKASGQVDRVNAAVRKLETQNAEMRAEMEANKLSASESLTSCLEIAKRERKCDRRYLAIEKQRTKMQEDIAAEKHKILDMQQELAEVEAATKKAEGKWRQKQKANELVLGQIEEEQRHKEASETKSKRGLEALRQRMEINFQRHKDDLQRLEQELARIKDSAQSTETEHQSDDICTENSNVVKPEGGTIARLLDELDQLEDSPEKGVDRDRECMICMKDEVTIVFLPCAHEVICANCNENYGKKGRAVCPYCRVPIEQRIRVYGASS